MRVRQVILFTFVTILIGIATVAAYRFWPMRPLPPNTKADKVLVMKSERRLVLLRAGEPLKSYRVSLGANPEGHKQQQGDERTPEGCYRIGGRNPMSRFHLSLRISYPNAADRKQAHERGVSPGGDIMIHGTPNGYGFIGRLHQFIDWTDGCIAVTDGEIEEIWRAVPNGVPIEIRP